MNDEFIPNLRAATSGALFEINKYKKSIGFSVSLAEQIEAKNLQSTFYYKQLLERIISNF